MKWKTGRFRLKNIFLRREWHEETDEGIGNGGGGDGNFHFIRDGRWRWRR